MNAIFALKMVKEGMESKNPMVKESIIKVFKKILQNITIN